MFKQIVICFLFIEDHQAKEKTADLTEKGRKVKVMSREKLTEMGTTAEDLMDMIEEDIMGMIIGNLMSILKTMTGVDTQEDQVMTGITMLGDTAGKSIKSNLMLMSILVFRWSCFSCFPCPAISHKQLQKQLLGNCLARKIYCDIIFHALIMFFYE
jgi:hypothetical protein